MSQPISQAACALSGNNIVSEELFPCALPNRFDATLYRPDFPILSQKIHDQPLVYLDNAGSTQRPNQVLQAMERFYQRDYANIHRGVHTLSQRATAAYEQARARVAQFLGAAKAEEIVFTKNATEGFNLLAFSLAQQLKAGDEILVSELEHHANLVPWQLAAQQYGLIVKKIPITDSGEIDLGDFAELLNARTKIVAVAHISNTLGTILPIAEITKLAHQVGARVVVDGTQAVGRLPVNVRQLGADFYVFTGHKLYGPTGIGAVYGQWAHWLAMPPWQGGGGMITEVSFSGTKFIEPPARFEAGTPPIAEAIGLAAAIDYVSTIGLVRLGAHEDTLLHAATALLQQTPGLRILGTAPHKAAIISFTMAGAHPHDIGTIFDTHGVAVRAGHHCAQPLMARFGVPATVRLSFGLYNTQDELAAVAAALATTRKFFG